MLVYHGEVCMCRCICEYLTQVKSGNVEKALSLLKFCCSSNSLIPLVAYHVIPLVNYRKSSAVAIDVLGHLASVYNDAFLCYQYAISNTLTKCMLVCVCVCTDVILH